MLKLGIHNSSSPTVYERHPVDGCRLLTTTVMPERFSRSVHPMDACSMDECMRFVVQYVQNMYVLY